MRAHSILLASVTLLPLVSHFGCSGRATQDGAADERPAGETGGTAGTPGAGGAGGTEGAGGAAVGDGAGGSDGNGQEPWRTETDPALLCWAMDEAFCDQFIECYGAGFSSNICTDDLSSHARCDLVESVSVDYIPCMEALTTPPCIGALPAICADVIVFP